MPGADDWFSITHWVVYLPPTYGQSTRRSREGNGSASSPSSTSGGEDGWGVRGGSLHPRDAPGTTHRSGGLVVTKLRTFDP
ncbi:hypothetical protein E2C01_052536 [Portunus trituberculatus]|uniref:Uncharacterized protein n=1 Tax=Portunus trituberculatus TaxID=210409 RepID=A0A5B7GE04_PORTR|nr:hypothetical protein [Portunus trituberculatus]